MTEDRWAAVAHKWCGDWMEEDTDDNPEGIDKNAMIARVAAALKEAYEAGQKEQHDLDLLVLGTAAKRIQVQFDCSACDEAAADPNRAFCREHP